MTTERAIRFDPELLEELDRRSEATGEDVSRVVNAAVARFLHAADAHGDGRGPDRGRMPDLAACADAYRAALLARDAPRAHAVIEEALAAGAEVLDVHVEVLAPAMTEIGHLWSLDQISIAQEHFATEVTAQLLGALAPDRRVPPTQGRLAIVSGTPAEQHVLGPRMVADLLQRAGWEVLALGGDTPPDDLVELAEAECPDLVALSTSTAGRLPGVQETLGRLAALHPRPFLVAGGTLYTEAVAEAARGWGADLVTSDLRRLLAVVRERFPPA
ncbi:MAG TPA: cobalamin-dependent protein [Baekduia sp.]|nr:cobalamin-dependent protein [Baekduia sp.]